MGFARGVLRLGLPLYRGEDAIPFGPLPIWDVALSLCVTNAIVAVVGYYLTRTQVLLNLLCRYQPKLRAELRDEAWNIDEDRGSVALRKRTSAELLFICVHNGTITFLTILSWMLNSPTLALHTFTMEIGYEVFDTFHKGVKRLEPENLIHHAVAPICILCSTQTTVDFRVLCHLLICIDVSGALLGYSKFLLRFAHVSSTQVYRRLLWVYAATRVVMPFGDSALIVWNVVEHRGGIHKLFAPQHHFDGERFSHIQTDWTQLYFWAMAVLNAFNTYFFMVIRQRSRMSPHMAAAYDRHETGEQRDVTA